MDLRFRTTLPLLAALLLAASAANASIQTSPAAGQQADAVALEPGNSVAQIPNTLEALEQAKAGEYGKLRTEDRRSLEAADREIAALTAGDRDLRTLDEQEKTRLFNAQETIMGIVGNMKRSQLVCTYRQNVGTRFRTRQCVTRDMAEAQRRASREATRTIQGTGCFEGEGAGGLCGNPN